MPSFPKPPKRIKSYKGLQRLGRHGLGWEMFKQSVFYPVRYFLAMLANDADAHPDEHSLTVRCSVEGCPETGTLYYLGSPDDTGFFWRVENMQVDHGNPRSHQPGLRYNHNNCDWMCAKCNEAKGGKHE